MRIRFFGTRGSVATAPTSETIQRRIRSVLTSALRKGIREEDVDAFLADKFSLEAHRFFGGNTSCVVLEHAGHSLIIDCGTGLRLYGTELLTDRSLPTCPIDILFSHYHWDHISGFPFFAPAYIPGVHLRLWGGLPGLEEALRSQQEPPHFPVLIDQMQADISFHALPAEDEFELGPHRIRTMRLHHPGGSVGYRIAGPEGTLAYLSDTEILNLPADTLDLYRSFLAGADIAIVDAQYTFVEGVQKISWGHSSIFSFIDVCRDLDLNALIMFHHDPASRDEKLEEMEEAARTYQSINAPRSGFVIQAAYDGMELTLPRQQ